MTNDTHKFESRYLDGLVGPTRRRSDIYRSPLADQPHRPAVQPDDHLPGAGGQGRAAEPGGGRWSRRSRRRDCRYAYLPYEGEQHGFRQAENIKRSLDAELYFYGRVFGFTPADEIEPVKIENL